MPSAHGPKIEVKTGSCALTFVPIKNQSDLFSELLTTKNRSVCADFSPIKNQSDVIQQWDLACHCHTIAPIIGQCAPNDTRKVGPMFCLR